jgi:Restriction endonuclease S subunits
MTATVRRVELKEIATSRSGVAFPTRLQGRRNGKYPFAKVGDISKLARSGTSTLTSAVNYVDDEDLSEVGGQPFPAGTIAFAKIGEAIRQNFRVIIGMPCLLDNNVIGVIPDETKVDGRYLYHFFRSIDLYSLAQSTAVPSIRKSDLDRLQVPLPASIDEQQRIAGLLDRADALRSARRTCLALLDELISSIFVDLFGDPVLNPKSWPRIPLGEVLDAIDSGKSPVCLDRPAGDGEWGVLKLSAVAGGEYFPEQNKALPEGASPAIEHEVRPGDLLLTRKNTYELVGACALVTETPARRLMPDLLFRLQTRPDSRCTKVYLFGLLTNRSKRNQIQALASGAAASMPNISKARLLDLPVEVPPLDLQIEYEHRLMAARKMKALCRQSMSGLDETFKALQARAFRGEL